CTLVAGSPAGKGWLHEIKFDGYRLVCRLERGQARLFTRKRNDWSARFPEIKKALEALPAKSAWLDGEVVALDKGGRSSFQALQNAMSEHQELYFYAFDLLYLDGRDLRLSPLI